MRILLHIGSEKTGSTSLQASFTKFRRQLANAGILYPSLPPLASHSILAVPFFRERLPREFFQKMGRDKAVADEIALSYWQEVATQVSRTQGIDTLLISGEHFLYLDDHQALLRHLTALFPGCQLEMLCYLARPGLLLRLLSQAEGQGFEQAVLAAERDLVRKAGRMEDCRSLERPGVCSGHACPRGSRP